MKIDEDAANVPDGEDESVIDIDNINAAIRDGARAGQELKKHGEAGGYWPLWSILLRGLRGMQVLCFEKTESSEVNADVNKKEMGRMMGLAGYAIYAYHFWGSDPKKKRLRSDAYKMLHHLDEIDEWFAEQSGTNKLAWNHPSTIVKHCPQKFLSGGMGSNQPMKRPNPKKKTVDIETERLKDLLIKFVHLVMNARDLAEVKQGAINLLNQINPADPSDPVDDVAAE